VIVVDTSALVAILQLEDDAQTLASALHAATSVSLSAMTLLEAGIVLYARRGQSGVDDLGKLLSGVGVVTVAFDERMAALAIEAFAKFGRGRGSRANLNFGDCASYALSKSLGAALLYKGDDFSATDIVSVL
jgi:ribonuclease VapC